MSSAEWKAGDWTCPNCHQHCFKSRPACFRCSTPRPAGSPNFHSPAKTHHHHSPNTPKHHQPHAASPATKSHHQHAAPPGGYLHSSPHHDFGGGGGGGGKSHSRRFLDKMLLNAQAVIKESTDATLFLRAIVEYEDKVELLARLTSVREYGCKALVGALTGHDGFQSLQFLTDSVLPVLDWLGCDDFSRGASKQSLDAVLSKIVQQEPWLRVISQLAMRGELNLHACTRIGWLILQAVSAAEEPGENARALKVLIMPIVKAMHDRRFEDDHLGVRRLTQQIRVVLEPPNFAAAKIAPAEDGEVDQAALLKQFKTLAAIDYQPGGRYDNDKAQYRDIQLLPTREEMAYARADEYLPQPANVIDETTALDRWFRLLRYDFVSRIKYELNELQRSKGKQGAPASSSASAVDSRRLYHHCHISGFFSGFDPDAPPQKNGKQASSMIPKGYFIVELQHDANRPLRRKESWWEAHSRELDRDSLVCILVDSQPVCFAQVSHREPRELASQQPSFGIAPFNSMERRELTALMLRKKTFQVLQCDTAYFSVQHVLIGLQRMTRIPLATELVNFKRPGDKAWGTDLCQHPRYHALVKQLIEGGKASKLIHSAKLSGVLDSSQQAAVLYGLRHRTAFIQGPPGTGKSFVGALLAKAIFDTTDETILCVCYTNHALDQFLLDLIDHGIGKEHLVRVGGSKRIDPRLEDVKLFALADKEAESQGVRKEIAIACKSIEVIQEQLAEMKRDNLLFWLKDNEPQWWRRFSVNAHQLNQDGMQLVGGKKGEKITIWTLLNAWQHGTKATGLVLELLRSNGHASPNELQYWNIPKVQRQEMIGTWEAEMDESRIEEYSALIAELHREQKKRTELMLWRKKIALEGCRIIGCTTTGAAKNFSLLHHVQAGVLVVEEAGEILEPHILTAMSDKIKHIIQIGDHKQLRPKTDTYELEVGHRNGYDLNRSMFERMVLTGFPHVTLGVQHRMHDDIASMVRQLTYPKLETSPRVTVETHPPLRGIQSPARVVFVNHDVPEASHQSLMMRDDGGSSNSKVNLHEAMMVVRTARYLLQQGYNPEQLVLLTPYLGQVTAMRDELAMLHFDVAINHMDQKDIVAAEAAQAKDDAHVSAKSASVGFGGKNVPTIKIATIDNYQGEEADVVLVSLVRCNPSRQIGFTGKTERVNVLLSRARHGIILFGSRHTLTNQKAGNDEWTKVFALQRPGPAFASAQVPAAAGGMVPVVDVRDGLPIVCARHPNQRQLLDTPGKFDLHAPQGGCTQRCDQPMGCGKHACPLPCHIVSAVIDGSNHAAAACKIEVLSRCVAGKHDIKHPCHQAAASVRCKAQVKTRCPANSHNMLHACHVKKADCRECCREREQLQREATEELERVEQLQLELAHQKATLQITLQHEAAVAERELKEKLLALTLEQNKELLGIKQAELKKQEAEKLQQQLQAHHSHIAQLQAKLAQDKAKAFANPLHASALASASSSSSSGAVIKVPKKLLNMLDSKSADFKAVSLDFHTSFAHMPDYIQFKFNVTGIHEIHSPQLLAVYEKAKQERAAQAKTTNQPVLAAEWTVYHGTHPDNITNIAINNVSMAKKGKLDPGWFGAGLYFSKHADYTMMYSTVSEFRPVRAGDRGRLFRFHVLPGRINKLEGVELGQPQKAGFESNLTPNEFELVLFDQRVVLPTHVIDFSVDAAAGANFDQSVEKKGNK